MSEPRHARIAIEYFTLALELGSYGEANKHFEFRSIGYDTWISTGLNENLFFDPSMEYRRRNQKVGGVAQ